MTWMLSSRGGGRTFKGARNILNERYEGTVSGKIDSRHCSSHLYHDWTKIEDAAIALFRDVKDSQCKYGTELEGITFCNGLETADRVWPRVECVVDEGEYPYELPEGNIRADLKVLVRSNSREPNAKIKHQQRASAIIDICWIKDPLAKFLALDAVDDLSIEHWHPLRYCRHTDKPQGELVTDLHIVVEAAPSDVPASG